MNTKIRKITGLLLFGLSVPTYALEPIEVGLGHNTWDLSSSAGTIIDAKQPNSFSSGVRSWWSQPWGVYDTINLTDLYADSGQRSNPVNLNLKQRLLSTSQNTLIDAGLGIKTIGFGRDNTRDGLRLSLRGQMGLGRLLTFYGESAWVPGLIESSGVDNLSGIEFETGVMLNPWPNLTIRAAYRRLNLDYTLTGGRGEQSYTEGIFFGTGIHW
jgi:hypothetical protein